MAIPFRPLPKSVFPKEAGPTIEQLNVVLRQLCSLEGTLKQPRSTRRSDLTVTRIGTQTVDVSRITPNIVEVVSGSSTVVGTPALVFGTANTKGTTNSAISTNSAIAIFNNGTPPIADAGSSTTGTAAYAARADAKYQVSTAAPSFGLSTGSAVGSATTLVRTDAKIAIFDTTTPAALASSASHGAAGFAADAAHVHAYPSGMVRLVYGMTNVVGVSNTVDAFMGQSYTIPANEVTLGRVFSIDMAGVYSTVLAEAGNYTWVFSIDGTSVAQIGPFPPGGSVVNKGWWATLSVIGISTGATGGLEVQGYAVAGNSSFNFQNASAYIKDTTTPLIVALEIFMDNANAQNSVIMRQFNVRESV